MDNILDDTNCIFKNYNGIVVMYKRGLINERYLQSICCIQVNDIQLLLQMFQQK